jgi:NTE family protein
MGDRIKIGLGLGGGASRGMAHLGVLKAFREHGIGIDMIVGSSAGALAGACYAARGSIEDVETSLKDFFEGKDASKLRFDFLLETVTERSKKVLSTFKDFVMRGVFYTASVTRKSFVDEKDFYKGISVMVRDMLIEDCAIKFAAVATDIISGAPVILDRGPMRTAVFASCAVPGVFPPLEIEGASLMDGSWVHPVPVEPLRKMGADFIIAVDITRDIEDLPNLERGLNIIFRINNVTRNLLKETQLRGADHVIRPNVGSIHWADYKNYSEIEKMGYDAASLNASAIKEKIQRLVEKREIKGS